MCRPALSNYSPLAAETAVTAHCTLHDASRRITRPSFTGVRGRAKSGDSHEMRVRLPYLNLKYSKFNPQKYKNYEENGKFGALLYRVYSAE